MSIDGWSLGCVAAELFLGLPLFPGACELDLLSRIIRWECAACRRQGVGRGWAPGRPQLQLQSSSSHCIARGTFGKCAFSCPCSACASSPPPAAPLVQHAGPAARVPAVPGQELRQILRSAGGAAAGPGWLATDRPADRCGRGGRGAGAGHRGASQLCMGPCCLGAPTPTSPAWRSPLGGSLKPLAHLPRTHSAAPIFCFCHRRRSAGAPGLQPVQQGRV